METSPATSNPDRVPSDVMLVCAAVLTAPVRLPENVVAVTTPAIIFADVPSA